MTNAARSVTWGDASEVTGRDRIQADRSHFVFDPVMSAGGLQLLWAVASRATTTLPPPLPAPSFSGWCKLNLATWQTEAHPLFINSIIIQYRFQMGWFCPVDRRGVRGLALTGDVNLSTTFALIKSSAARCSSRHSHLSPLKDFWRNIPQVRVTFNGLHCCVGFNGPERARRGGKKKKKNKAKSSLMTKEI